MSIINDNGIGASACASGRKVTMLEHWKKNAPGYTMSLLAKIAMYEDAIYWLGEFWLTEESLHEQITESEWLEFMEKLHKELRKLYKGL